MKKYKKIHQFLESLTVYSLTALISSLVFSYHLCFPSIKSIFVSIPNLYSHFLNPKCLFVVGNIIICVLVGESKLASSNASFRTKNERSRNLLGAVPNIEHNTEEKEKEATENHGDGGDLHDGAVDEEEEEHALPLWELNHRVEVFIARVNQQRWLEANLHH